MRVSQAVLSIAVLLATVSPVSGQSGTTWAAQAMASLTGGVQPHGVMLQASVTRSSSGQQETGAMTLQSSGLSNSRIDVTFGSATWSEIERLAQTGPAGNGSISAAQRIN